MWSAIATFCLRNRFWLLIALGIITVVFGFYATKVKMTYDYAKVIPKDDPDFVEYIKFKETFGEDGNILVIGVKSEDLFKLDFLNDWYKLSKELESRPGVEKVVSITNTYTLFRNDSLKALQIKPVLTKPLANQAEADSFQTFLRSLKIYDGLLYNADSNVTLIAVTLKKKELDSKARIPLVNDIETRANAFGKKYNTKMHFSGLPYVRTIMSSKVADEIKIFTFLSILITAIFIFIFFRFLSAVLLSLVVVTVGVVATLGCLAMLDYKITMLTGILPPLMVIIGVQNCIYLLNVYHQEYTLHGNKMKALTRLISKNGLPLFLTNVTTAVGFMVFSFSGSAMLDQFSVVSGIIIMLVYVVSLVFNFLIYNKRKSIYIITIVLVVVSLIGSFRVKNLGYVVDDLPETDPVFMDLKFFERNLKGTLPFEISIDTKTKDGVKDYVTLQKINRLEKELYKIPEFSKPMSVVDVLKFANQGMHDGDDRYFMVPNVIDISNIVDYLPKQEYSKSLIKSMVDSNYQVARISVQMADIGSQKMKVFTKIVQTKIDSIFPKEDYKVKITGTSAIFLKGNDYLIENLIQSMIAALLIISVMMAFLFFSWRMVLISLIPNLIPLIMTFGIMGFFGIRLKPSTIIIFSIAYGIVVDFTIHYLAKYRHSLKKHNWDMRIAITESVTDAGPSIIYTAVALFGGFIIFAASNFGGTVALGILTSLALIFGMFMNLILLPSILLSLEKHINAKSELGTTLIEIDPEDDED